MDWNKTKNTCFATKKKTLWNLRYYAFIPIKQYGFWARAIWELQDCCHHKIEVAKTIIIFFSLAFLSVVFSFRRILLSISMAYHCSTSAKARFYIILFFKPTWFSMTWLSCMPFDSCWLTSSIRVFFSSMDNSLVLVSICCRTLIFIISVLLAYLLLFSLFCRCQWAFIHWRYHF